MAFDTSRVKEVYNREYAALRSQVTMSNQYNLLFRHEPKERWHRVHSNELMRGVDSKKCRVCEYLFFLLWS